jgi:hypothetical protein
MKRLQTIALTLVVCALLTPAALAGVKTKQVTFDKDIKVGDTLVKKGSYKVTFDEESKELTILNGKKVVAKTTARLEETRITTASKPKFTTLRDAEGNITLVSIYIDGKSAIIGAGDTTAGTPASTGQKP